MDRTADPSSFMDKLKNCWTSAVLWTLFSPSGASVHKTADLSSFMDTFQPPLKLYFFCVHKTADLSSFMDPFPTVSIKLLRSAVLWTLSRHPHRTADLSSFMDTFVHNGEVSIELLTSAVLWTQTK